MHASEYDAHTEDVSPLDSLCDSCRLVRVGVVLGHEPTSLCAPADRLRLLSHMLPPFRWLWVDELAEPSYFFPQVSALFALMKIVLTLTSASQPR